MSYRVNITAKAEAELYGAALWWAEHRSQEQAFRWLEGFEAALASLAEGPQKHALAREDADVSFTLRQLLFGLGSKPTHRALFRVLEDEVIVYGVRHLARRDVAPEDF
jgi:plasmid stabilization system protein ParE